MEPLEHEADLEERRRDVQALELIEQAGRVGAGPVVESQRDLAPLGASGSDERLALEQPVDRFVLVGQKLARRVCPRGRWRGPARRRGLNGGLKPTAGARGRAPTEDVREQHRGPAAISRTAAAAATARRRVRRRRAAARRACSAPGE